MRYVVILERGPAGYGADVPDLPGVISLGESEDEVTRHIHEAIEVHLARPSACASAFEQTQALQAAIKKKMLQQRADDRSVAQGARLPQIPDLRALHALPGGRRAPGFTPRSTRPGHQRAASPSITATRDAL